MEINKRVRQTGNKKKGSATQPSCLRVDQFDVSWLHLRDYLVLRVDAQETVNLHRQKCNHYNIPTRLVEYLRSFFPIKIKQFRDHGTQPVFWTICVRFERQRHLLAFPRTVCVGEIEIEWPQWPDVTFEYFRTIYRWIGQLSSRFPGEMAVSSDWRLATKFQFLTIRQGFKQMPRDWPETYVKGHPDPVDNGHKYVPKLLGRKKI